jgi:hypothetical protein
MKFTGKNGKLRICAGPTYYVEVPFANMDFSCAMGRPKTEEQLVLNRGIVDGFAHYIEATDAPIYDPIALTFSCLIDETYNGPHIQDALSCGNVGTIAGFSTWTDYGASTKGLTKNDGVIFNPRFMSKYEVIASGVAEGFDTTWIFDGSWSYGDNRTVSGTLKMTGGPAEGKEYYILFDNSGGTFTVDGDPVADGVDWDNPFTIYKEYKCVNIQYRLESPTNDIVWKFSEVYFPMDKCTLAESAEGLTLTASGGVYGTITRHTDWQSL